MLTNETMGIAALAILWMNVLLIAAAAGKQLRALLARRAALAGITRGRVARGDGPGGAIAAQRIEQVGRAADGAGAIVFHDREVAAEIFGGRVALEGGGEITVEASDGAEVWLDAEALARAAGCVSAEAFDQAFETARKAKGFARTVRAPVGEGAEVFVSGGKRGDAILIATMDPRALLAKKAALAAIFIVGEIAAAAACTAIALRPPLFGAVSTIGGVLCLGLFLLVQPLGTAVRDAVLVPSRAPVRGRWTRVAAPAGAHAQPAA